MVKTKSTKNKHNKNRYLIGGKKPEELIICGNFSHNYSLISVKEKFSFSPYPSLSHNQQGPLVNP